MLDFGVVYAASETGKLLADFGADVIPWRAGRTPTFPALLAGAAAQSAQFVTLNRSSVA